MKDERKFNVIITTWGFYNPSYILQSDGSLVQYNRERDEEYDAVLTEEQADFARDILARNTKYRYNEIYLSVIVKTPKH